MKKGLTELVFTLDRSGSMHGLESDTVGGYNGVLDKQRQEEGEALVTTVLFSDASETLVDRQSLEKTGNMTDKEYRVGGCTALLDAIGGTVNHIEEIHRYIRPEDVPEHTVVTIITDGMENASRRFSSDQVKSLISKKKEQGWEFLFLGANIDAVETAGHLGIDEERAVKYKSDKRGTRLSYSAVGEAMSAIRANVCLDRSWKAEVEEDTARRER